MSDDTNNVEDPFVGPPEEIDTHTPVAPAEPPAEPAAPEPAPPLETPYLQPSVTVEPPPHQILELEFPKQFCQFDRATGNVTGFYLQVTPPEDTESSLHVEIDPPFSSAQSPRRTPSEVLRYRGGKQLVWEEDAPMYALATATIAQTYVDVDGVYMAAVGYRTSEYEAAETAARAYLAAEVKPSPVSDFITSHAEHNPTGEAQSHEWAAQRIVERADAFHWAIRQMRYVRAASQAQMRAATTKLELDYAVAQWDDFIIWLKGVLSV